MADVSSASGSRAHRIYGFALPRHFPGFGVGTAIRQMKRSGVWDQIPGALRRKIKAASGTWSVLRITKSDLDSIPDDVWERIAKHLGLKWKYAAYDHHCYPRAAGDEPVPAPEYAVG